MNSQAGRNTMEDLADDENDWVQRLGVCSNPDTTPLLTKEELDASLPGILAQLNIKSCTRSSGAIVNAIPPMGGYVSNDSGCEQVTALASKLLLNTRIQMCMLSSISQRTNNTVDIRNRIRVELGEGSRMLCGDLIISNDVDLEVLDKVSLSANMVSVMSAELLQTIKEAFELVQTQETGFMATAAGQRAIAEAISGINTDLNLSQISAVITDVYRQVFNQNEIIIMLGRNSEMSGSRCVLENKTVLKQATEAIVASAISATMDIKSVLDYFKELGSYQQNKNTGLQFNIGGMLALIIGGIMIFVLALLFIFLKYGSGLVTKVMDSRGFMWFIIFGGIGFLAYVAFLIYTAWLNSKKADAQAKLDELYPPCPDEGPCPPVDDQDPPTEKKRKLGVRTR